MSAMKKPCFLFVSYPFGGIENFVKNLQKEISTRDDIESHWLFIEWSPRECVASIPIVSSNWTLKGGLVARSRIRLLESGGKHFDAAFFNSMVAVPFLGEFRHRIPIVLWLDATPQILEGHSQWWDRERRMQSSGEHLLRWRSRVARNSYAKAEYLLCSTEMVMDSLVNYYDVAESKIKHVPLGVDTNLWKKSAAHRATSPSQAYRRPSILFVGGEFERKGGDVLLKVTQRKEFEQCEFHVVTRGELPSHPTNVHVHNNIRPNSSQLLALYAQADVFVLPTRADLAPTNVILEAMSMELPVISTDVGGIDKVVLDGKTGYIVPVDDEEVFAERLQRLISSESLRKELGHNGRRKVEAEFNIERSASAVLGWMKAATISKLPHVATGPRETE